MLGTLPDFVYSILICTVFEEYLKMTLEEKTLKESPLNKYVHMLKPCWAGVWEQECACVHRVG